jgi:ATP-dependent Clp protease ATP-binding subunit ClpC
MIEPELIGRFTTHLREALQKALTFALQNGRDLVEPGDLLVGLLRESGSLGAEILEKFKITPAAAEGAFHGTPTPRKPNSTVAPDLSVGVKKTLEKCVLTAHLFEHKYVGTEHLLMALLETPLPDVHAFFAEQGLNMDLAKEQVTGVLRSTSRFPDLSARPPEPPHQDASPEESPMAGASDERPRPAREKRPKALEIFARELTHPDIVATLDPVIGRETEIDRVIEILCRRTKNNPILLGEPGVGKTAIVEGLAQRLHAGEVPDLLQGKRVLAIDLAMIVAGTMYRGEFEARLKQLVEEVKADKNVLLFIDEIHNLVGAGSTSGSLDAANILKPALARGEIHCIGATTWAEFKKHIEPDAALERRYQPVEVPEPSPELTQKMLHGLKTRYEDHHGVKYDVGALEAAVRLAERYLTDRFFPDKAIDLLDEAAAHVSAKRQSRESMERMRSLDVALDAIRERKERAVNEDALADAASAMEQEDKLLKEKETLEKAVRKELQASRLPVTAEHIAAVVARMTRVSLPIILAGEREQLRALEDRLRRTIVGQDAAVDAVAETVRKARLGLSDPQRPKASFLFVGPSGVGKTELARALAKEIFGREETLVKLDMSEFAEGHSVSKLLGSPAGYVGYREGNRLTDTIKKHPHSVLLFDEFEKAHPDVQHLLLQALEEGRITEATGKFISLRHAYVILTSNAGSEYVNRGTLGFGQATDASARFEGQVKSQLQERFRPELLNRLDRIVVFQPLAQSAIREIVKREMQAILDRMEQSLKVGYAVSDDVLDWLVKQDRREEEGARSARRVVERELTSLLGRALAEQPAKRKYRIQVKKNILSVT